MNAVLNIIAGCCGIISGFLWFLAAIKMPTPPTAAYYNVVDSPTSPFARAWRSGTRFNRGGRSNHAELYGSVFPAMLWVWIGFGRLGCP
jgi:hypothetical protein